MNSKFDQIVAHVSKVVLGKEDQIRLALTCLLAGGHLLIEDIPGIGKTTLAKVLSLCLGLNFRRIQCTSDMLPGDILGVSVFERKSSSFLFHPGPIFSQVMLADEINRATPKTQSALLEAMEERQVTVEGKTRALEQPFFVIATQNPIEQSGTFPLPESQLDRFLMRIDLGYPNRAAEKKLLSQGETRRSLADLKPLLTSKDVLMLQQQVGKVKVSDALLEYVQDLLGFTRQSLHFHVGLSPRAGLNLLAAAKSRAYMQQRDYALPEDLQQVMPWVVGHRLRSRDEGVELPRERLMSILLEVPLP
ncbi:MAG: MoxR family ATPase [Deltaproteobacteria bacterium]|jgi:MoxR-like ATPase|nr:MoxR family ATPase [Deltaproteobacteria bacterium]